MVAVVMVVVGAVAAAVALTFLMMGSWQVLVRVASSLIAAVGFASDVAMYTFSRVRILVL